MTNQAGIAFLKLYYTKSLKLILPIFYDFIFYGDTIAYIELQLQIDFKNNQYLLRTAGQLNWLALAKIPQRTTYFIDIFLKSLFRLT